MANITPHIKMRVKVIYSFKLVIYLGATEIKPYSKTGSSPCMFASLKEIQAFTEEQKWLDEEVWSKACLPGTRTTKVWGNYEGRVVFKHVQTRLVASNEPLMCCWPLPDWLRDKHSIYAMDTFDDNLCTWRCLIIYKRLASGEKIECKKETVMQP